MLIDIHTHSRPAEEGIWRLGNFYKNFFGIAEAVHCSAGLHPWYITEDNWQPFLEDMKQYVELPQLLAIGECGLDKVCETNFALQRTVFAAQVQLANTLGKPLIIHCVRAYDEVLAVLQQEENKVPVIFHGFNRDRKLAVRLSEAGHYLSLGKAALNPTFRDVILSVPLEQLLLETDDANDISIADVYKAVAAAWQLGVPTLTAQIESNTTKLFGKNVFTL